MKRFIIESDSNFWEVRVVGRDTGVLEAEWSWYHDEKKFGVGGEKVFAEVLKYLGYHVEVVNTYEGT